MVIMPYKLKSRSARRLAEALGIRRVRPNGRFRNNFGHTIINWGCPRQPVFPADRIINNPDNVALASNKALSLEIFSSRGVPTVEYTKCCETALSWLREGFMVVCRTLLRANSGKGIVLAKKEEDLIDAPLYTKYFKKKLEFRVHVAFGEVVDIQQKRKRSELDREQVNFQIRNASNGWVFCRNDIDEVPDDVKEAAKKSIVALGLDFGAVDVGFNVAKGLPAVFEVNTAPGLEGTTLENYCHLFGKLGY